ncbi:MAG: phosphohydrolase [Blautia sp.]
MNLTSSDDEFYSYIRDIVHHPVVLQMKKYPHHGKTSCYQHCLNVSYYNYRICKFLGWDARSAARAGMLHDLFLYDWHTHAGETGNHFHGLTHPWDALQNARKYFPINDLEREMILKHMWPLTVVPPGRKEAFIICITDKYCGSCEKAKEWKQNKFRLRYPWFMRLLKKVFGNEYHYKDYQISSEEAAEVAEFVTLRKRPSDKWRKGDGKRVRRWK